MTEQAVAATLAIMFDDRHVRRHLAVRHPEALERAHRALELLARREARDQQAT